MQLLPTEEDDREKKGSCVFKGHSHFGERTNRGFGIRAKLVLMEGFVSWFLWSAKFLSSRWGNIIWAL